MDSVNLSLTLSTVSTTTEKPPDLYYEHEVRQNLMKYAPPVIIILGSLGNLMTFIVLQTKSFRKSSVGFVLSALAVVDTCLLNTALLRQWIMTLPSTLDIRTLSVAGCKIHVFLTYFLPQLSSWTLVLLTIERGLSVTFPLKVRDMCSRRRMVVAWIITTAILAGLCSYMLWGFTLVTFQSRYTGKVMKSCYLKAEYRNFWNQVWPWLDFCFLSFIPGAIILVGNILIIYKVLKARRLRRQCSSVRESDPGDKSARSTTTMLIAISVVFLLLTSPNVAFFIGLETWHTGASNRKKAQLGLAFAITNLLYYANSGINFALYCLTGSQFRRALKSLFKRKTVEKGTKSTRSSRASKFTLLPMTPGVSTDKPSFPTSRQSLSHH